MAPISQKLPYISFSFFKNKHNNNAEPDRTESSGLEQKFNKEVIY